MKFYDCFRATQDGATLPAARRFNMHVCVCVSIECWKSLPGLYKSYENGLMTPKDWESHAA